MTNLRAVATALLLGTATLGGAAVVLSAPAYAANVRPEIGAPLKEAQSLAAAGNYKAALAKVNQAEAVGDKTADESAVISQMKQYIGTKSGDVSLGGAAAGKTKLSNDYAAKNYAAVIAAVDAMKRDGKADSESLKVAAQSYYLKGDKPGCIKYIKSNFSNPDDATLQLLMRCAYDAGDDETQRSSLETLVARTGKPEHWASLLKLSERAKALNDHQSLNIYRLKLATGTISNTSPDEYTTLAQLLIQLKLASEAQTAIQKGIDAGVLKDARTQRLMKLATTNAAATTAGLAGASAAAAKDPNGDALILVAEQKLGAGDTAGALADAQAAQAKAKDKDNAAMVLGQAQLAAGQKADALKTFNGIKGSPNASMVAHLYALYSNKAAAPADKAPAKGKKK